MSSASTVTVIVPAFNEEGTIGRCLDSLRAQTLSPLEILVVDDGSTDATAHLAQGAPGVTLLRQDHAGPGAARNLAAARARGDILAFADADLSFDPAYLERLTAPIREGRAVGTFTKEEYVRNRDVCWSRFWAARMGLPPHRRIPEDAPDDSPVFRAILREAFLGCGGYDPTVGYGEDHTLSARLGRRAAAASGAVCHHDNPDTLGEVFRSARWLGKGEFFSKDPGLIPRRWARFLLWVPLMALAGALRSLDPRRIPFDLVYEWGLLQGIRARIRSPDNHAK